jgi:hypothetical protein
MGYVFTRSFKKIIKTQMFVFLLSVIISNVYIVNENIET